jgi:hypothetical protein
MSHTMIRRIHLIMGVLRPMNDMDMRCAIDGVEEYLMFPGIRKDERIELEDWRRILFDRLLDRQIYRIRHDIGLEL